MTTQGKNQYVHEQHPATAYETALARAVAARPLPRMTESEAGMELASALQLIDRMQKDAERAGTFEKTALLDRLRKSQAEADNMREAIREFAERVSATRQRNPRRVPQWILDELEDVLCAADLKRSGESHE